MFYIQDNSWAGQSSFISNAAHGVTRGVLWEGKDVEGTREKETHISVISNSFMIVESVMLGQVAFPEARGWCVCEENGDTAVGGTESKEGTGRR